LSLPLPPPCCRYRRRRHPSLLALSLPSNAFAQTLARLRNSPPLLAAAASQLAPVDLEHCTTPLPASGDGGSGWWSRGARCGAPPRCLD
ncbi:hypothetical protein U9M48_037633, partial [Paspalum notatum var. saurae]